MHHPLSRLRRGPGSDERGAVAVMMAISLVALLISSAMVLDFGLVRVDRQVDKSAADSAVTGGLYSLIGGDGKPHPYAGICGAINYLKNGVNRFSGLSAGAGTFKNGSGTVQAGFACATGDALLNQPCTPGSTATWASFHWTGSYQGAALNIDIHSGYNLATSGFVEETLPAVQSDNADTAQGCDQLAVVIRQNRKPGLGSLATSQDLVSTIRSVGRLYDSPGGDAPAMLLLKRGSTAPTGCPALQVGSTAGSSWIRVYGARSTSGRTQAGTIHSDSTGVGCANQVFYGKASNGIIAYAAPQPNNVALPDPGKPGRISSVAGTSGITASDDLNNVYGTNVLTGTAGAKAAASGRTLVSRAPVDARYLGTVRTALASAQTGVFTLTAATAPGAGYTVATCSSGNVGTVTATKVFVDCGTTKSMTANNATTVVFNGSINPSGTLSLPVADHVYIAGGIPAIDLGNTATFSMHTTGTTTGPGLGTCIDTNTASKAVLFVKNGNIKQTGGSLQLCNTTVFMMGGQADGCVPGYTTYTPDAAPAPTQAPCTSSMGTGQIVQTGGGIDWTAPNRWDEMTLANGQPDTTKTPSWADTNGPEDLALWDESAGNDSSTKYQFTGGGTMHLQGIFMVPNADPISLSGNANFVLTNAQFVATSLALASNNTTLSMTVDPNAAVTLPKLSPVGLVR